MNAIAKVNTPRATPAQISKGLGFHQGLAPSLFPVRSATESLVTPVNSHLVVEEMRLNKVLDLLVAVARCVCDSVS